MLKSTFSRENFISNVCFQLQHEVIAGTQDGGKASAPSTCKLFCPLETNGNSVTIPPRGSKYHQHANDPQIYISSPDNFLNSRPIYPPACHLPMDVC